MLASRTSRWSAGAVLLSVLILVAAWFLLIGPRRSDAADVRAQAESAQSQAATLQTEISRLKAEFGDLQKRRDELAAIKRQLPSQAAIPDLVRDLRGFAADAGVSLDSLTPGAPAYFAQGSGTAAAGGTAQAAAGVQLVQIPVTLNVSGDYFEDSLFLKYLQTRLDRAILVTGVTLAQGGAASTGTTTDSTTTSGASATPNPTSSAATGTSSSTSSSDTAPTRAMSLTAEIFVLPDDGTTLADVAAQAKAAARNTPAAKAPAGTSAQ